MLRPYSVGYFCIGLTVLFSFQSCSDDVPELSVQERIDLAVSDTREAVEAQIGTTVPTLNIFIQTPDGSWFSSSAGEGYAPITAGTYFRFASNTKHFTATALLNMAEDGWLRLDDPITANIPDSDIPYVPATEAWDIPYKDQITIRTLLNHSAGVYDVDNDEVPGYGTSYTDYMLTTQPDHQFSVEEMVEQLVAHDLSYFPPGQGYHYSNTGFAIAGEIARRVYSFRAGNAKSLSDYLALYIYGAESPMPLPLHFPNLAEDQQLPSPYSCGNILLASGEVTEYCAYNMSAQVAEGNGYGTMQHLNTYIRSVMKGENVLLPASVEIMKNSVSAANPTYGLGCFYQEGLGYGHNGARIGNLSLMLYDPEYDISFVSYINAFSDTDFLATFAAISDVAYAVREALGYPGKP